jgi:hypothetical protein
MYFFADHPDEPHQEYVGQVCRVLSSSLSLSLSLNYTILTCAYG